VKSGHRVAAVARFFFGRSGTDHCSGQYQVSDAGLLLL